MAAGEYVSMKAQNELIERELQIEERSLQENPQKEIRELQAIYMNRGLAKSEALLLSEAIHKNHDVALEVHAREELGVDPSNIGNPNSAAISSFLAFAVGAYIPLIPWIFAEGTAAIVTSLILAILAAAGVGVLLAKFTERSPIKTAFRQILVAIISCSLTFALGSIFEV